MEHRGYIIETNGLKYRAYRRRFVFKQFVGKSFLCAGESAFIADEYDSIEDAVRGIDNLVKHESIKKPWRKVKP